MVARRKRDLLNQAKLRGFNRTKIGCDLMVSNKRGIL